MAAARGARSLEGILWLARAFAGVAGAAACAQTYASGHGPLGATLAAAGIFGVVYALLLAAIRRYGRLLEQAQDDDLEIPGLGRREQADASTPPRLVRTRRKQTPPRRLMAPEGRANENGQDGG